MGIVGFAYSQCHGETAVQDNILAQMDLGDPVTIMGVSVVCLTLLLTLQLVLPFCREALLRFAFTFAETWFQGHQFELKTSSWKENHIDRDRIVRIDEQRRLASSGTEIALSRTSFIGLTLALYVSQLVVACAVPSMKYIWFIFGGTMATILSYTIPAACYLSLTASESVAPRKAIRRGLAWAMYYLSMILCVVCTSNTLYIIFYAPS